MSDVEPMSDKELELVRFDLNTDYTDNQIGPFEIKLRRRLRSMLARLDALQAVVDKLPKTADGVTIVPGMEVWVVRVTRKDQDDGPTTSFDTPKVATIASYGILGSPLQRLMVVRPAMSFCEAVLPSWVFTTREAAEAALNDSPHRCTSEDQP